MRVYALPLILPSYLLDSFLSPIYSVVAGWMKSVVVCAGLGLGLKFNPQKKGEGGDYGTFISTVRG
jgi:hypothetical protein